MLRDLKLFRRNSRTVDGNNENLSLDQAVSSGSKLDLDPSRPPFSTIQEFSQNPNKTNYRTHFRRKNAKNPPNCHSKESDQFFQFRTPEKLASGKNRSGLIHKSEEPRLTFSENKEDILPHGQCQLPPPPPFMASHPQNAWNAYGAATPRSFTTGGKASSVHSGTNSTQSTPTKSVTKPLLKSGSRATRAMNFLLQTKGLPLSSAPTLGCVSDDVPHFELSEDPSFWMDHNVQVVVRVRPINSMEKSLYGYSRCIKQESAQNITWIGQSEARFVFDYVACETVNQEVLFRVAGLPMVENCMSGYNSCVFAYGQTGSGKTHTMLGEINDLEIKPSADRGMTPRIFEFLFARIKAEEESRRDEKLQYSCKCSFLEIYNEQITDLLNPSSTNLLIREDPQKGVHVENLTEIEVENVYDILKLLIHGAANRKVASTNMNHESSRSHSVFTCTIESRWEKDTTTTLRFARLNLVDLAGSERQKTSGAEGDRLKEASNINKSLSTLGHVIMILADMANGRQRHVPYRDSRLTFLLQDSLGGNSKTMIIANVSPSISSASETLCTLKFAQRAKTIQNNAIVNENASGDVLALQQQIHLLKAELSILKQQNVCRSLSFRTTSLENAEQDAYSPQKLLEIVPNIDQMHDNEELQSVRVSNKKLKLFESTLAGALRREKMADVAMRQLEAEIEQLNRLVRQRQEDTQCSKMMIKFREDKINRMEALLNGLIPSESYLREENNALTEEIKMLLAKADRNPEVTRFALENMRLLERLRKFQDFYDEGERDFLLSELSDLRNQLVEIFDGKLDQKNYCKSDLSTTEHNSLQCCGTVEEEESLHSELKRVSLELDDCKSRLKSSLEINAKLTREINGLNIVLKNKNVSAIESNHFEHQDMDLCLDVSKEVPCSCSTKYADKVLNLELEVDILKTIVGEEKSSCAVAEERAINAESELSIANENLLHMNKREDITLEKLKDAKAIIEALESQQIISITELEELRENNSKLLYTLKEQEQEIASMRKQLVLHIDVGNRKAVAHETLKKCNSESESASPMQEKLKRMQASLEKAWNLNLRYQSDQASLSSNEREMDEVHRQVEAETAEVIVGLQEELATLNQLVDDCNKNEMLAKQRIMELENERKEQNGKLHLLTMEITGLSKLVQEKEQFQRSIMEEWELLAFEIADLLQNGNAQLDIANFEVASISDDFSHRSWISEQFGKIIKDISKRDCLIEELRKSLKDACNVGVDVEQKLRILRGAALAITEAQQQDCSDKESRILYLKSLLAEKMSIISKLEDKVKDAETTVRKVVVGATIYFVTANRLFSINNAHLQSLEVNMKPRKSGSAIMQEHNYFIANEDNECKDPSARLVQNYQNANSLGRNQQSMQLGIQWENEEGNNTPSGTSCSFVEAKMKLKEFQVQMSTLKSCINEYTNPAETHIHGMHTPVNVNFNYKDWAGTEYIQNTNMDEQVDAEAVCDSKNLNNTWRPLPDYVFEREKTIENLKKEIKSALQSLEGVQSQMAEMFDEKELIKKSTLLIHESIKGLTAEVHQLHSKILNKEKEFEFKLFQTQEKLQMLEGNAMTFDCLWRKEKEKFELEISEVTTDAAHKAVEASNLLMKIEEAQGMMQDADIMVNELMEANKIAKLEINKHKEAEISLSHENCYLVSKIHNLQASLDEKDENIEGLQKDFKLNIIKVMDVVHAVESQFRTLKDAFIENFTLINHDLDELKSWIHQQFDSRMWLEEIWLSIMGKDCAASVLHLCHVGILAEKITGLKAENCFIQNELSESNSLVATLKEQNINDKKELQMFNILKGKLLDINYSLAQVTKKEHETSKFSAKLCSFDKKILDLQHVEDTILERSNAIGAELDVLKNELNENNEKALKAAIQEESIRFNEQVEATNKRFEDLSLLLRQVEATNKTLRDELDIESKEKVKVTERLEIELFNMNSLLNQNEHLLEVTQKQMNCIKHDKDNLESHVSTLNEKLIFVKEKEGIAVEKLENLSLENEEFKFQVMKLSKLLNEVQGKYEVIREESNSMKTIAVERLKKELLDAYILLGQRDHLVEELQKDMSKIAREKDELESEVCTLKEMLKLTKPNSEKNEVLATDAPQRKLLTENAQLRLQIEHIAGMLHELQDANQNLHDELEDKMISSEILQKELLDLNTLLFKRNHTLQESQKEMAVVTNLRDQLGFQVSILKEQLEMTQSLADENEAIAIEARQIAEESKAYSQVKEEEVKMLERSVEELECTINALQEQVMIVKEEAERQEQQRNVLELEKEAARNSNNLGNTIDSGHFELSRHLKETLTELKDAQHSIQLLQKEASEKEIEIAQCKAIISELNLHAEAQAREYKRKFKELEAMAFQVQSEFANPSTASLITSKSEKSTAKPRGSGSPFKCIGLGIVQQINTEKDEELTAARCQIEELEALAASRQKQIFMLNIRLAAAESMTHDVLRDLLGIKLDMTKYAKVNERSSSDDTDAVMEKDKEWRKLKMQVNEFVEERQSLLEEINEKHKELIAAQIRLEKIQEHEKLLNTENELLKVDNVKYKSIAMELEAALEKALKYTLP